MDLTIIYQCVVRDIYNVDWMPRWMSRRYLHVVLSNGQILELSLN